MKLSVYKYISVFFLISLSISCQNDFSNQPLSTPSNTTGTVAPNKEINNGNKRPENKIEAPSISETFKETDLRYNGDAIKVTHHAKCRMNCRKIEAFEIQEIVDKKTINQRKTNRNPSPGKCPSIAYEGRTQRDNQKIRVILGECENRPIIITVIDLENEYRCNCK